MGDSVTTDHISPAGSISAKSPAGKFLIEHGVQPADFNSYGSRRGNDRVMTRGTFANIRIRNQLAPGTEGGVTRHLPDGQQMSIYDAAMKYKAEGVPLVILAGAEYGTGSSRDWAAKGTMLLGIRAVLAASFERIHRSNLVGMGVLPLQFLEANLANRSGLTGEEVFDIPVDDKLQAAQHDYGDGEVGRWRGEEVRRQSTDRYAGRARLLPPRRHSADGAAEVVEEWVRGNADCAPPGLGARAKRGDGFVLHLRLALAPRPGEVSNRKITAQTASPTPTAADATPLFLDSTPHTQSPVAGGQGRR